MHATASPSLPWNSLPTEMKLSVVEHLSLEDVRLFATVNRESYSLSIPAMWRVVDLKNIEALHSYCHNVPPSYHTYTRQLSICTKSVNADMYTDTIVDVNEVTGYLATLLRQTIQVVDLTLNLQTSMTSDIIPVFQHLYNLRLLAINHCGDEQRTPLSERLVVSIAATVPGLTQLSLDRIARSSLHAPELIGSYGVPLVSGDGDIPPHPSLGSDLALPSLLRLPTLRNLRIRDTHLGDPRWSETPVSCSLEVLDLGSCYHESQDFNRQCTERIVGNVGHTVDEFTLSTAVSSDSIGFTKPRETPLKNLRKIHLTPLFPVDNVVDTLTTLSGSPIEELSIRCHEDDVVDMCSALEEFLTMRVEKGESDFYQNLAKITVDTVKDLDEELPFNAAESSFRGINIPAEHAAAVKSLQEYCRDLRLSAGIPATETMPYVSESYGSDMNLKQHSSS